MHLKLDTIYTPLTYDELVKPLIDYGKAYKEVESAYSTLAEQAESFKDEVNRDVNGEAFTLYDKYSTDLNSAIEDFSKGMTVDNRRKLLEMKRRYAGEIKPIAKASEALKEANAFRDKAGPDAIFKVNRYTSLDDFLHGKTADNSYVSAKQLAAQASAKALTAGPNLYREIRAGGDTPITTSIYDTLWEEAGGDSYDDAGKAKLHEAIMAGINSAAYKLEEDAKVQARAWAQINEQKRQFDANLGLSGFKMNKDGQIEYDKDSPVWAAKGLVWDEESKQMVKSKGAKGTLIPIVDENGVETGNYHDTSLNKIVDENGNIVVNKKTDVIGDMDLTPLYFEAWSEGASNGFQSQGLDRSEMNISEADTIDFSHITGRTAKNYIKEYIKERFNYTEDITDEEITQISKYLIFLRDSDPLSDNHFMVYIKGSDTNGGINNKDTLERSILQIRRLLKEDPNIANKVPTGKK